MSYSPYSILSLAHIAHTCTLSFVFAHSIVAHFLAIPFAFNESIAVGPKWMCVGPRPWAVFIKWHAFSFWTMLCLFTNDNLSFMVHTCYVKMDQYSSFVAYIFHIFLYPTPVPRFLLFRLFVCVLVFELSSHVFCMTCLVSLHLVYVHDFLF